MDSTLKVAHDKLKQIRARKDLNLKPTPFLKETFTGFDGEEYPLKLRYYQVQGVLHMVVMNRFVLGDDTGTGKCQPYDTLVLTDKGLIEMGSIEDWSEMEEGTFRPLSSPLNVLIGGKKVPVKHFYYGGVKPTVTATTRYGFKNTGSRVHPMLVRRDGEHTWVQAQDLVEGDYLCVERSEAEFPHTDQFLQGHGPLEQVTPKFARFLGYYVGEGTLSSKTQVSLAQCPKTNPDTHAEILSLFEDLFGRRPLRENQTNLYLSDTRLRRWLHKNGLDYCTSPFREVPACVLRGTRTTNVEFLKALFEGEGHAGKSQIEISTASEVLGRQIQLMLLRFGIVACRSPKMVQDRSHVYWRLTIGGHDAELFQEKIGFASKRKQEALRACLDRPRNTNHDVIPQSQYLFEQVRQDLLSATTRKGANSNRKGSGLKQFGPWLVNGLNNIRNFGRNPSYEFTLQVIGLLEEHAPQSPTLKALERLVENHYFYDPIISLEEGEEEVFDIEVDDLNHAFVANGVVNHNTLMSIASYCYVCEREPDTKAIILTNKSVVGQWALEFEKFTTPGKIKVLICKGSPKKREKVYEEFSESEGPTVMIMGYATARQDISHLQGLEDYVLITDEATAYKNPSSQIHQVVRHMSHQAKRVWGLTATLIKNNLIEGYGIYQVVCPGLFPKTKNQFMNQFCIVRMQPIAGPGGRRRQVPVIVGYRKEQISRFRETIDPYFLARSKMDVASELPVLTFKEEYVGLTKQQKDKYQEALDGLLEIDATGEEKETTKLTALIYCQQIVDHPELIDCEGKSEKMKRLFELLTEGDFEGQKVIVFSRFRKMVDLLEKESKKQKLNVVRITGAEDEDERKEAMQKFQDPASDVQVCFITSAAAEGVNLQAAKGFIFYDLPWSAGDLLQLLGRMIRIGSTHDRCYALYLIAKDTIDAKVLQVLRKKMKLIESVMGKRIKGEKEAETVVSTENDLSELFDMMRADAQRKRK